MKLIRARVVLLGVQPEIWRLIELDREMTLDDLHEVIQVAMGWQECHLHHFSEKESRGPVADDGLGPPRVWITDFEIGEGTPGLPERETALFEALGENSPLFYTYDFGDNWVHRIELIEVIDQDAEATPATLVRGSNACPPEDSGGPHGYMDLLEACNDPDSGTENVFGLSAVELTDWANLQVGPWRDFDPEFLDVEAINAELGVRFPPPDDSPPQETNLSLLVEEIPAGLRTELRSWLNSNEVESPLPVSPEDAAMIVRPYMWLLDRVGKDGVKLTQAGYMPPQMVHDLMFELGWDSDWIGKNNREDLTPPAMELRERASEFGLIRKSRGRLVLTPGGRSVAGDPGTLLKLIAERFPASFGHELIDTACLFTLIWLSGGRSLDDDDFLEMLSESLGAAGFVDEYGDPPDRRGLNLAIRRVRDDLKMLSADQPPHSRSFARLCLRY